MSFEILEKFFRLVVCLGKNQLFLQKNDLEAEHQREMEGLLESVRQLSRELSLQMLIIDSFVPSQYQVR